MSILKRRACCCGTPTCTFCGETCPDRTGLTVTVSDIALQTTSLIEDFSGEFVWEDGATIAGTFCLYWAECGTTLMSLAPVKAGRFHPAGDPDGPGEPIDLYLTLIFGCAGAGNPEEPTGPDGVGPYVEAYITGTTSSGANQLQAIAFSTRNDIFGAHTYAAWSGECDVGGIEIANAATTTSQAVYEGATTIGGGGTIVTGAACSRERCETACTTTGAVIDFTGGPLDGVSIDADGEAGACGFTFDDGTYYGGAIFEQVVPAIEAYTVPGFRLTVQRKSDDVVVFVGFLFCDGEVDPALGRYDLDPLDPSETYAVIA